jgi:recombination protein RecA
VPVPEPERDAPARDPLAPLPDGIVSTGFPALDAVLGRGGLPRDGTATFSGAASSGKTTLALRCVAESQARGGLVAYLDLPRALDPVEAVARGVDLEWLVVIRSPDPAEGFGICGALLAAHAIDLLVVDLPARLSTRHEPLLRRLGAHARRISARLIVLQPASLARPLHGALAESAGIRLGLERQEWIRVGRDVVGQRTLVTVEKDRSAPPGRQVELEIHYADEADRTAIVRRGAIPVAEGSARPRPRLVSLVS